MKKIILLLLFLSSMLGYSQMALEGFENTTGPDALPATNWTLGTGSWAVFDNGVGTVERWNINSSVSTPPFVYAGTNSAYMTRENIGAGNTSEDYLATPAVTIPANGQLKFFTRSFTSTNLGTLYQIKVKLVSAGAQNVTTGYTQVQQWDETTLNTTFNIYEEKTVDLSAYSGQQVYVAFVMKYTQPATGTVPGDRWLVDNARIIAQCLPPTALTATAIAGTTATLGWTSPGGASSYEVENMLATATPTGVATGTATTTSFSQTGLAGLTNYKFYARTVCGTDYSTWAGPFAYTTTAIPPGCGGNFVDAGGTANYPNSSNSVTTICPTVAGEKVTVTFTAFDVEASWDGLYVFDGNSTTAPQIASANPAGNVPGGLAGAFWGTTIPGPFTSTSADGCLTFRFRSDASVNRPGWVANVTCALPPTCPAPTGLVTSAITSTTLTLAWNTVTPSTSWQVLALPCTAPAPTATSTGWVSATANSLNITGLTPDTCYNFYVRGVCSTTDMSTWAGPKTATTLIAPPVCGGTFVDAGGATNNYPNSSNTTYTICPTTPGDLVTVTFTAFDVEASWDGLYVFDGNSTTAPQIASTNPAGNVPGGLAGAFWGTTIPGPFTSSSTDGCLTFRFRSDASVNRPGWVANVTCAPAPTCKKPNALTATSINLTGATLGWTQLPNPNNTVATAWEVLILPAGSPAPTATTTGALSASSTQYIASGLTSATCYDYYVRAVCSTTDSSFWAGPKTFCTAIANDECANATTILTNSNMTCTNFGAGILIGATASSQTNGCGGTADDDVWFQFVATATTHAVSLTNVTGSTTALNFGVYSGTCTGLTQVLCNTAGSGVANGLIVGQTYFVRIFSATATPGQNTAFNLCIGTIPPAIQTNNTQYTTQQLVQDVLLNSTCATVSNITSSTGSNFGSVNGLASFTQNGSGFPFANGIVLSTGDALKAKGPNTTTLSDGNTAWTGDTDLESIILSATGNPMTSRNATKLEFDFIPISNSISFDFIFASEEYGTFQCEYSDAFAFLLTNTATGVTTNLAVVPNTTDPISVVTVRNQLYNNSCTSVNPNYFAQFNNLPTGINPLGSALNFNGQTVVMTASSPVTSNTLYHIKLVVADRSDSLYDSAVFLKGGSFSIGNLELGNDLLQATGNAICAGSSQTINTGLDASLYTFVWKKNNVVIAGQTGPSLTVTDSGTYTVSATYNNSSCVGTDSVTIEFYPPISAGTPNNLVACNTTGVANFDLTQNNSTLLGSLTGYTVSYFTSSANANSNTNAIASPSNYTNTSNPQTIWARVQNTSTGCFVVKSFTISVQNNMPTFTVIQNVAICAGSTGTITVTPTNYTDSEVTYSWTLNGNAIANSNSNSINVTQAGTYQVSVNRTGCIATASITVTVTTLPVATFAYNATSYCKTGTNPVLSYTNGGVAGTFSASPTGLSINASTGAINLSASSVGSYTITNSIAAAGGCLAVSATFDLTITAPQDATFSYTGTPYCQNATNPSPTLATGSSAGVFSSTTGLSINSSTGLVNLASSTPGTYTVTNTIAATGGCAASIKTATIVITAAPQASIAYGTPFCSSESNVQAVTFTGTTGGSFSASPTGLTLNATTGGITPSTSTPGTYTVKYTIAAAGGCPLLEKTTPVTITAPFNVVLSGGCEGNTFKLKAEPVNNSFNPTTAQYSWSGPGIATNQMGVQTPIITQAGVYNVSITDASGCIVQSNITITSTQCIIQKGISPNNDDQNDFFDLTGLNVKELGIFNRYGIKVYSRTNYKKEWFGQSDAGEELPDGAYYYVIESDGKETKTGWVYINRENK